MQLKTETRNIDGLDVTTTQLPAMRSYTLLAKLGKVAGPALGQLGGANLGALAGALLQNLDPTELPKLTIEILASTTIVVDGRSLPLDRVEMIDTAFSGRLPTMLKVVRFVLEANYASFFDDGSLALGGLVPGSTTPSPTSP